MKICKSCLNNLNETNWYKSSQKKYYYLCISCHKNTSKKNYKKESAIARASFWAKKNPHKVQENRKKYKDKNREILRAKGRQYIKENPHIVNANTAKRRALKRNATPTWLTKRHFMDFKLIYKLAKLTEKATGIKYEVDHIVPLAGKDVCGLHVPWNLQHLPAKENIIKGNKVTI
jgi:hypothetical protein